MAKISAIQVLRIGEQVSVLRKPEHFQTSFAEINVAGRQRKG